MRPAQDARVIIRHAEGYEVQNLRKILREGLEELGLAPHGRTLVKPNLVAAGELFRHAYTRPEFLEGVLLALQDRDTGRMTELAIGERCGITIPTRYVFDQTGLDKVVDRLGVTRYLFDETRQVEVALTHEKRLRDYIFVPEPIAKTDFFVNCPKFKSHPWTTVTFSMKNYIGIQDDRHRLIDHDHALNRKVADLQHVIQPEFIAIDCIIAGEGRMLTPIPRTMNLVIMGNNQVAIDAVCSRIIGVDPREIEHIRLAYEDGFGPIDLEQIRLSGDVSLETAQERAKGFQVGLVRVEKYFEGTRISAYSGPPPKHPEGGYCWGGCPGALEEAIEVLRLFDAACDETMPRMHIVFGNYKGPLDINYGEKVIFVGDCVNWNGELGNELIQITSKYKERTEKDPHTIKHDDIYAKMLKVTRQLAESKNKPYIRLEGCPVSVAELILVLSALGGTKNPYFDQREIVNFNRAYLAFRAKRASSWLSGDKYQVPGQRARGQAKPDLGG
jgi:uncharacterized protein (DUF362 family)